MICANLTFDGSSVLRNISTFSLLFYLMPLILNWKILTSDKGSSSSIQSSIQSSEFYIALVCSLSMVIPMTVDLFIRIALNTKSKKKIGIARNKIISNLMVLLLLIVPDTITLFYAVPHANLELIGFIIPARVVCISWTVLTMIHRYSGSNWSIKWSCMFHTVLCLSGMPESYCGYFNYCQSYRVRLFIQILQLSMIIISSIIITLLSYQWYRFIYPIIKNNALSTEYYLCNIYVTAFIITGIGLFINYIIFFSESAWYEFGKSNLINHYIMFTIFYIMVVIFESRCLQREYVENEVIRCSLKRYE